MPPPRLKSTGEWLRHIIFGIFMGTADLVPGVSGGTMAFVLGFYEDLIASVKSISIFNPRQIAWSFLSAIFIGVLIAFVTFAQVIHAILGDPLSRTYLYAAFFGLIIASVAFCLKHIKKWHFRYVATLILGAGIAFLLTSNRSPMETTLFQVSLKNSWAQPIANYDTMSERLTNVDESALSVMLAKGYIDESTEVYLPAKSISGMAGEFTETLPFHWINGWLILCGMLAVCAMLLPGISGSYMLVILGMYAIVIGSLADFLEGIKQLTFPFEPFLALANLGIGILIGALLFSRVISWLLDRHHQTTISMLIGFMIGALPVVWPFWTYQYVLNPLKLEKGPQLDPIARVLPELSPQLGMVVGIAFAGFASVLLLEALARKKKL